MTTAYGIDVWWYSVGDKHKTTGIVTLYRRTVAIPFAPHSQPEDVRVWRQPGRPCRKSAHMPLQLLQRRSENMISQHLLHCRRMEPQVSCEIFSSYKSRVTVRTSIPKQILFMEVRSEQIPQFLSSGHSSQGCRQIKRFVQNSPCPTRDDHLKMRCGQTDREGQRMCWLRWLLPRR